MSLLFYFCCSSNFICHSLTKPPILLQSILWTPIRFIVHYTWASENHWFLFSNRPRILLNFLVYFLHCRFFSFFFLLKFLCGAPYQFFKLSLESIFISLELVLFPGIVEYLRIITLSVQAVLEQADAIFIVWFFIKLQLPCVVQVFSELMRVTFAERIKTDLYLLLQDLLVLLSSTLGWETLPR